MPNPDSISETGRTQNSTPAGALPEFDLQAATQGRYRYVREVGVGGMGRVVLAWDRDLEREVAVKVLEVTAAPEHDSTAARFVREAKITAGLIHPGIVPVYDLGHTPDGRHFFIMQMVEGLTLRHLLRRAAMDAENRHNYVPHLLTVFARICQAVGFAHHKEIVHLDLKPSNLMEGPFGEVLVMDWGVARRLDELHQEPDGEGHDEQAPAAAGSEPLFPVTTGYAAPELVAANAAAIEPATDVFALGIVLFEILTGRLPFEGRSSAEIQLAMKTGVRPSLQQALARAGRKRVPQELAAVCDKALNAAMPDRYRTATEMGNDIRAYLENRAVSVFRETLPHRVTRWLRRHRTFGAAAVGGLCTAAIVATAIAVRAAQQSHDQHLLTNQYRQSREVYRNARRKAEWLRRQLRRSADRTAAERARLRQDMRQIQLREMLTLEHLRWDLLALLDGQGDDASPDLCREFRRLWLRAMALAMEAGSAFYVRVAYTHMQTERGRFPWWDWQHDEFNAVEAVARWLRDNGNGNRTAADSQAP